MKTEIIECEWLLKNAWTWKATNGSWAAKGEQYTRRYDAVRGLRRFLQRVAKK